MLTERVIRDAKPTGKAYTLWDSHVAGLGLQVTQAGKRNYVLRYKDASGRKRQAILCRASEVSLREVRQRAGAELVRIRGGEDDPLKRRHDARTAPTVAEGLARYFGEYVPARMDAGRLAPSTVRKYHTLAERYILPELAAKRIADVTIHDVERMAKRIESDVQRNRTIVFASRVFNLFETWGWRPQHSNPARGIEKAREVARDRTLSPGELGALSEALAATETRHPAPVAAIRFMTITGLRVSEVLAIRWEDIDFEAGRLTLPSTKTGRRVHDLPSAALAILAALPRMNEWAFTTGRDAPTTYRHVRRVFIHVLESAGVAHATLHDIRRTVMTAAAATGIGTHVLRDLLGHKSTAMADRYIRALGNPVRDAREQVGSAMAAMMAGNGGEVVPMERRRRG